MANSTLKISNDCHKALWASSHRHNDKRVVDLSLLRLIDVFHADLPSIGVTIADPCLVTLQLRFLTLFRDDPDVIADLIDLNNLVGIHRASMTTWLHSFSQWLADPHRHPTTTTPTA